MALASAESFDSTIDVMMVVSNDWLDVETSELIPHEKIGVMTNKLLEAGRKLEESTRG